MYRIVVSAEWDNEAGVWVASSEDVPGLITEAASLDQLVAKLDSMIPELLSENKVAGLTTGQQIPVEIVATHQRLVSMNAA